METHAIDCDMGEDCTCGEVGLEVIFVQVGESTVALAPLAYEMMLALGFDLKLPDVIVPPRHPEHGHLEI